MGEGEEMEAHVLNRNLEYKTAFFRATVFFFIIRRMSNYEKLQFE
jgi:hypothetical protein